MIAATITNAITHSNIPNLFRIILRYWSCDASLAQSRDAIQGCVDVWSKRDGYATAMVTVGVILECFEVTYAFKWYVLKKIDRTFMRGAVKQKGEPEWFAIIGAVGLLLVILGVAGEWVFEGKLSEGGRILSNFDHNQTLIAEKQAGDAKQSAYGAATVASTADSLATAAGKLADQAQEKAWAAEGSAAQVEKLEVQLRAEVEEDVLIFAAGASRREFLPNLFASLKDFPPAKAEVRYNSSGEPTTRIFAENLCSSLEGLGWIVTRVPRNFLSAGTTGTIVVNKWESRDDLLEGARVRRGKIEANISMWAPHIEVSNGISSTLARRLVTLGMSLNAKLIKEPTVDSDSFLILIGDPEPTKGK